MGSTLCLLLALVVSNTEGKKPSVTPETDHSLMKTAVNGISELANKVTPIPPTAIEGDKTADSGPAAVVWVHMSKKYLADYVERSVDHQKPAHENVLGIIFTGQSQTVGKTRLVLRPNDNRATADVEFVGTVHSQTIGHSGPATLQYMSESDFHARKSIVVGDAEISTTTASVDAPTRLTPTSIATSLPGLRGLIGDRIARRREAGSRAQAEAIVGRDTANDIRHDFDIKLDSAVADIQKKVQTQIADLKLTGEKDRVALRSRSTREFMEVALCPVGQNSSQLQMTAETPFHGNPDLAVCIHRSLLTSLVANAELRAKVVPMLTAGLAISDNSNNSGPSWTTSGDWLAVDLSGATVSEVPRQVAATTAANAR